jgi:hypothetical protein
MILSLSLNVRLGRPTARRHLLDMDNLPLEILVRIFKLVCTDGGKTVNALRVQSHAISAVTNLIRFRNVAVTGVGALGRLVDELAQVPPDLRRIEHLFVSDVRHSGIEEAVTLPRHALVRDNRGEARSLGTLLSELLVPIGPYLCTLTILLYSSGHFHVVPHVLSVIPLPILTTLALRLADQTHWQMPLPRLNQRQLPSLRILTLDFPINASTAFEMALDYLDRSPILEQFALHSSWSGNSLLFAKKKFESYRIKRRTPRWTMDFHINFADDGDFTVRLFQMFQQGLVARPGDATPVEGLTIRPRIERPVYAEWQQQWQKVIGQYALASSCVVVQNFDRESNAVCNLC